MINVLNYQIAKVNISDMQFKMLQMIFTVHKKEIRNFCIASLLKDKVLKHCNRDISKFETGEKFFQDVMIKYYYDFNKDLSMSFLEERYKNGESSDHFDKNISIWLNDLFFQLLDVYEYIYLHQQILGNFETTANLHVKDNKKTLVESSAIILNTLIDHKILIYKDPAFADVSLDDFKENA